MTINIDAAISARILSAIPDGNRALWESLASDLVGAPLDLVTGQLQAAAFDDHRDADLLATSRACGIVLADLTPPVTRGLSEVAQIIGEIGVVAGAVRWTAAAISQQIQQLRDRRRHERDDAIERTDLIELY